MTRLTPYFFVEFLIISLLLIFDPCCYAQNEVSQGLETRPGTVRSTADPGSGLKGGSIDPLAEWWWRNPLPSGDRYLSVAYGKGRFVAISDGAVYVSPDGITWTETALLSWEDFHKGVSYGNGTFVIVGFSLAPGTERMSPLIYTSPDGITWTRRNAPVTDSGLSSVNYLNGVFVAVGCSQPLPYVTTYAPFILTSRDGVTWTVADTPVCLEILSGVAYGNGQFVAVGDGPILTSYDGVTWKKGYDPAQGLYLSGITYGNGYFVAVGDGIRTSSDGVSWYSASLPEGIKGASSVTYGNGRFVTAGGGGYIMTSSNGWNWTAQTIPDAETIYESVAYGNGMFVAVGAAGSEGGAYGAIASSPDGVTWTERSSSVTNRNLYGVAYGNSTFVAVGPATSWAPTSGGIVTSTDGVAWQKRSASVTSGLRAVIYGKDGFVAIGYDLDYYQQPVPTALTSPDGIDWTERTVSVKNAGPTSIAYGNGVFVAVGSPAYCSSTILTSPDGAVWTERVIPVAEPYLKAVAYGNGTFVATGRGVILTSPDGVTWTGRTPPGDPSSLLGAAYGNGTFVVVGNSDTYGIAPILTSPDGITWTLRTIPYKDIVGLNVVTFANGMFLAMGWGVLTSLDGIAWTLKNPLVSIGANAIAYGNRTFVAVGGDYGHIIQSSRLGNNLSVSREGTGAGSIVSSPSGINCGRNCMAMFQENDVITLTASAGQGSDFAGWSGGCTGRGACTVVMSDNVTVTAKFNARPSLNVSPASLNFGRLKKGSRSAAKIVTVRNSGVTGSSLTVNAPAVTGPAAPHFTVDSSCTTPLAKGEKCSVSVSFTPLSFDTSMSAVLEISSDAPVKGTAPVKLTGGSGSPKISVSPLAVSFPATSTGPASIPSRTVTVRNTGISDLTINSVSLRDGSDASFGVSSNCTNLPQNKTCKVTVAFDPATAGKKNGWIDISSNASSTPVSVKLAGSAK